MNNCDKKIIEKKIKCNVIFEYLKFDFEYLSNSFKKIYDCYSTIDETLKSKPPTIWLKIYLANGSKFYYKCFYENHNNTFIFNYYEKTQIGTLEYTDIFETEDEIIDFLKI
jgi:hypothetical protein